MQPEELFEKARAQAGQLEVAPPVADATVEQLRLASAAFFDRIDDPPVYRRVDDPARAKARAQLEEGLALLARALALARDAAAAPRVEPLADALRWHLASLCHVAEGRLALAERAWLTAAERESAASALRRAWARSDEARRPVYERTTGTSRFDPSPEPLLTVKLVCPHPDCQAPGEYALAPTYATHRFTCARCRRGFVGFFGEARGVELTPAGGDLRRYLFKVQELNGVMAQVQFEDDSGADFLVARRDLLAFLYTPERHLKAVLNLSSARLLWVQRSRWCFIATAALGPDAPELEVFRTFRDQRLLPRAGGRVLVRAYYRWSSPAARWLSRHPAARAWTRKHLVSLSATLARSKAP
jgi:hypothetical protein